MCVCLFFTLFPMENLFMGLRGVFEGTGTTISGELLVPVL